MRGDGFDQPEDAQSLAGVGFLALAVSSSLERRSQTNPDSAASGVLSRLGRPGLAFLLLMVWSAEPGTARGLFERLSSGVLSLWIFVFALRLQRR